MNFKDLFWDFIKDPIASALLFTLFWHAKLMFQEYSLLNSVSVTCSVAVCTYFYSDSTSTF